MASYNVADLSARLGLKTDKESFLKGLLLVEGLKVALRAAGGIAKAFGQAVVSSTFAVINQADALQDLSDKTNTSAQALQELGYAASFGDVSMDQLSTGLKFLSKNMVEAVEGNDELKKAFRQLGVPLVDSTGKIRKTDEVLVDLADKFSKMPPTAARTAMAMKVFGKAGTDLLPLLVQGRDKISAFRAEFNELSGGGFSQETIDRAGQFEDNVGKLKVAFDGVKRTVAEAVLPALLEVSGAALQWVKANQTLVRTKVREWVEAGVKAIKNFVAQARAWIDEHGGLNAVIEKGISWLKAFAIILAAVKIAEFVKGIMSIVEVLKLLRAAAMGTGIGALVIVTVWAAQQIIENWDDVRAFFILVGDTIALAAIAVKDAFAAAIDWVVEKVTWAYGKVREFVDWANPFSIDDNSSSGVRGVTQSPALDRAAAMGRQLASGTLGLEAVAPRLVETGRGGGASVQVSAPVTITATRMSGESDEAFSRRLAGHVGEHMDRTMREAQAGIIGG